MNAIVRLHDGRALSREDAERLLELKREQLRRREAKRLETERSAILAKCQSLHGFIEEFWYVLEPARTFKTGWALKATCAHLEKVTSGDIRRLLITLPPGMMKSQMLVFWTAWEWGPKDLPHLQALATSYSQANVLRDNLKLRRLIESEKYQALWPLELRADQNAKGKFENARNGFSEARPFSSMTGGRGDRVKIDDPHSTETAESEKERENTIRIFRESITDRFNDVETSALVIIMQRLHAADVAAVAKEIFADLVHLNLPMEFEPERVDPRTGKRTGGPCRTYVRGELFFEDPRTKEGELLFPERFPPHEIEVLKKAKGSYAYAGQYQQRPGPREGGLFKRVWFEGKIIDAAPSGTVWVRHWDLAATKDETAARTAGVKMGRTPDGRYIVGHVVKTQDEGAAVRRLIRATAEADGRSCEISLPQDPGQAGKVQAQDMVAMLAGFTARARPETGDKVTRAEPFAVQCEAGNVYLLEGLWIADYLDELCEFPNGKLKDQVDASSGAFARLITGARPTAKSGSFSWG